jgi:hypothetical protein
MKDRQRLDQLRLLLQRAQRMPESPERDWMLSELRARAVDVETGMAPRAMRPLKPEPVTLPTLAPVVAPAPAPVVRRAPKPVQVRPAYSVKQVSPTSVVAKVAETRAEAQVDWLATGGLLSLDDEDTTVTTQPFWSLRG